jgi:hypothetical protein
LPKYSGATSTGTERGGYSISWSRYGSSALDDRLGLRGEVVVDDRRPIADPGDEDEEV